MTISKGIPKGDVSISSSSIFCDITEGFHHVHMDNCLYSLLPVCIHYDNHCYPSNENILTQTYKCCLEISS